MLVTQYGEKAVLERLKRRSMSRRAVEQPMSVLYVPV